MKKNKLPESFRAYFWDVDFDLIDKDRDSYLVIKRVLDRGNTKDIIWMLNNYGKDNIKEVLLITKDLSRPTGYFWAAMMNLDSNKLP